MDNFDGYEEELVKIANTYLANILNQEAILVSKVHYLLEKIV